MEQLDLSRHGPMQWQDKLVELNGSSYIVRNEIAHGGSMFVFALGNLRSRLFLHVLKIFRDQRKAIYSSEGGMERLIKAHYSGAPDLLAWIINVDLPGGRAQIQMLVGDPEPESSPTRELFVKARDLEDKLPGEAFDPKLELNHRGQSTLRNVMGLYEAILKINPDHTEALTGLARAKSILHDWSGALALQERALAIEANYLSYWQDAVRCSVLDGQFWFAHQLYTRMKEIFPFEFLLKDTAIAAELKCGQPDAAQRLLDDFPQEALVDKWQPTVHAAACAQAESAPMISRAKVALQNNDIPNYVAQLEEAHRRYQDNPQITLNLGLAYQRVKRYSDAASLLASTLRLIPGKFVAVAAANAAFSEARSGRPKEAVAMLSVVASYVVSGNALGSIVSIDSLPGLATWVDDGAILQSNARDATPIVVQAVNAAGGAGAVPPRVVDLADFYEMAAAG
jgi:tetratricopeptide (TPR) repeat protein